MRDSMKACQHTLSDDVIYKEVVVIGNGPSGMVTSFMLAGNVPCLKSIPDDAPIDEMLKARLSAIPPGQNLYETDLMELAEGIEGRSQNPIPLLMDSLLRPGADIGMQMDPLIEWKYDPGKEVDHVVLGRGSAGGAWPRLPAGVRTLSPAGWLWLPPLPLDSAAAGEPHRRMSARAVAHYCRNYVRLCGLQRYFRCGAVVTSVTSVTPTAARCRSPACPLLARFLVTGYDVCAGGSFRVACRGVVVACGGGDRPGRLPAPLAAHCVHSLDHLERALHLTQQQGDRGDSVSSLPVVVVGSGVSAADAVRRARGAGRGERGAGRGERGAGRGVAHLHRAPPRQLAHLHPDAYPDYCEIYKMMCDGAAGDYENYKSYPEHIIVDVIPETTDKMASLKVSNDEMEEELIRPKRVKIMNLVTNEVTELTASIIAVFIGSKPDLFFLQTNFNLSSIQVNCTKCLKESNEEVEEKQCFLRNRWHYLKSVLGQSIQSCKSRYLNYTEINGNNDTKCVVPRCHMRTEEEQNLCNNIVTKYQNGSTRTLQKDCHVISYTEKASCQCEPSNPYSSGIGLGVDPTKPVDCKHNPLAIDKSTHELLNTPKGIYALGPITGDNFIRFIPGGALAIVSNIHKQMKSE